MTSPRPDPAHAPLLVLFVCTGNICRSPMAEVVFCELAAATPLPDGGSLAARVRVESAGTSGWHEGSEMDERTRRVLDARGFDGHGSPARQVTPALLARTDVLVALDRGHRAELVAMDARCAPRLLRVGPDGAPLDVADPYYGGDEAFEACLDQIVAGCTALAADLAASVR